MTVRSSAAELTSSSLRRSSRFFSSSVSSLPSETASFRASRYSSFFLSRPSNSLNLSPPSQSLIPIRVSSAHQCREQLADDLGGVVRLRFEFYYGVPRRSLQSNSVRVKGKLPLRGVTPGRR